MQRALDEALKKLKPVPRVRRLAAECAPDREVQANPREPHALGAGTRGLFCASHMSQNTGGRELGIASVASAIAAASAWSGFAAVAQCVTRIADAVAVDLSGV